MEIRMEKRVIEVEDKIYIAEDGKVYHYHIPNLSTLFSNPNIVLTPVQ